MLIVLGLTVKPRGTVCMSEILHYFPKNSSNLQLVQNKMVTPCVCVPINVL